jgi:hypothetical protein
MLSFHVTSGNGTVQINCDDAGISRLIEVLVKLRGSGSHVHLRAPSCGAPRNLSVNVKIMRYRQESHNG